MLDIYGLDAFSFKMGHPLPLCFSQKFDENGMIEEPCYGFDTLYYF
jgi:hypothetical protein